MKKIALIVLIVFLFIGAAFSQKIAGVEETNSAQASESVTRQGKVKKDRRCRKCIKI